ncbi:Wadjet anti-phage system protein JetD domain-containing protein [Sporosarcina sp. CAU 1771]
MEKSIRTFLLNLKKKTVTLHELEQIASTRTYPEFAKLILSLESDGVLSPIQSHGTNGKQPALRLSYRIHIQSLQNEFHKELVAARVKLHSLIRIEHYFELPFARWQSDYPYLLAIHTYLNDQPLPTTYAAAPERSFELVANEKWITELGGKELLERIELWDKLLIIPVADPLMFAINPRKVLAANQRHLIVENKTTYQALLPKLQETDFSTLIYGVGNKIVKSIENFAHQYPVHDCEHTFYYFGDIDYAGLTIWHRLSEKVSVLPALPFYKAALLKTSPSGKQNQARLDAAVQAFNTFFPIDLQQQIEQKLADGYYYPQEILQTSELQAIWRDSDWTLMN